LLSTKSRRKKSEQRQRNNAECSLQTLHCEP
jgi:hypothetical protein